MARRKKKSRSSGKKSLSLQRPVKREITGVLLVGAACLMLVTLLTEQSGWAGKQVSHGLLLLSGEGRVTVPILLGAFGILYMRSKPAFPKWSLFGVLLLWLVLAGVLHLQLLDAENQTAAYLINAGKLGLGGGIAGAVISASLLALIGLQGSYVLLIAAALIGALCILNRSLMDGLRELKRALAQLGAWLGGTLKDTWQLRKHGPSGCAGVNESPPREGKSAKPAREHQEEDVIIRTMADLPADDAVMYPAVAAVGMEATVPPQVQDPAAGEESLLTESPWKEVSARQVKSTPVSRQLAKTPQAQYCLPSLSLLQKPLKVKNTRINKDLTDNVKILEETLANFGVRVKVTQVMQGPSVTRYEAQPAPGIKVSRITNLSDDIALSLAATHVRIEAPVPGKAVVGIEVPNREIAVVPLREVLECQEFQNAASKLSVALGKDITGNPVVTDMIKMPHLLIAGATGSGKSVCINTIIHSILFKARPDEVKILLVDPKMVELANYNGIPHLLAPVVTDAKKAASALKWVVTEMESRYELFAANGVRDIVRYNFLKAQDPDEEQSPLPYVVVIIDELADLMMVAPGEVEDAICRLAQMARASGIHLIVATQRPSVDVITGLIKANIPSRIAFAVSSQTDSRTILDGGGAEKLFGRGDMLFYPMGASKALRVQGCYLADTEVENVIAFLKNQAEPEYTEMTLSERVEEKPEEELDEHFYQAGALFIESGNASVSLLQRRFRIGYTRAGRLMDQLEGKGVVGGYEGSKPREVCMSISQFEQKFGNLVDKKSQ
ncbi:MAG: DNA translocase FtsK [Peptococcaceae bacterium]|nr:DNA translocase FtsK [Peptococcaceae bacterium]